MSRFTVRSTSRSASRTPFCAICKKAGKTQQEFNSHFVRDAPNGNVVCPTLLSTECRYCHDLGHTKTHCPKLADKARRQSLYEKKQRANDKKFKAENRLRAQVEAAQAGQGETFLTMSYGRTSIRMPIKCQPVSKKGRKTAPVGSTFAAFCSDSESDDEEIMLVNGPAVAQAVKPAGVWGNGAAAIAQSSGDSKPQRWSKPKKVTFQNDDPETLMKPIAAEMRTYVKGSPTNEFVEEQEDGENDWFAEKRSSNAWQPRARTSSVASYDTGLQCDAELRSSAKTRTVEQIEADIKEAREELSELDLTSSNWDDMGEIEDLQDKISDLEDELKVIQPQREPEKDQFGRPSTDNSSW